MAGQDVDAFVEDKRRIQRVIDLRIDDRHADNNDGDRNEK